MNSVLTMPKLLPLLPMAVVAVTALLAMIAISLKRAHTLTVAIGAVGLNAALVVVLLQFFGHLPTGGVDRLFVVDGFALFNMAAILVSALACLTLAHDYFDRFKDNKEELYLLMLISTLGAMLMVSARHFASFFMALELLSVPMYGMLAYHFKRQASLESGIKYLILSAVASATLLMGMALIFAATGTLIFAELGQGVLSGRLLSPLTIAGAVMMIVAVGFKLSLAPFHAWVGDVYAGSPAPVTGFLASVSKVAMVALALRFLIDTAVPALSAVNAVLVFMITLSVLVGNLLALHQSSLKRLLAYSSIAHMGYAMMALVATGAGSDITVSAYMLVYALTSVGAFGVIVLMSGSIAKGEADEMDWYKGLFWRRPVLTAVMTLMLLSLAGIPFTAGFMTKVQIMLAVVQGGRFWLAFMLIVGSAVGLYYYLKAILVMYKRPLEVTTFDVSDNWRVRANGLILLLVAAVLFIWGVLPNSLFHLASFARIGG